MNMKKLTGKIWEKIKPTPEVYLRDNKIRRLKVYTFQEDTVWYLHVIQKRSLEELREFYSCQYRARLMTKVPYTAAAIRRAYQEGTGLFMLTGYLINQGEIIEIEDWPQPVFFYVRPGKLLPVQVNGKQGIGQLSIQ